MTLPHKVTINIIISSFPFVAFCKYPLLILQIENNNKNPKYMKSLLFHYNYVTFKAFHDTKTHLTPENCIYRI